MKLDQGTRRYQAKVQLAYAHPHRCHRFPAKSACHSSMPATSFMPATPTRSWSLPEVQPITVVFNVAEEAVSRKSAGSKLRNGKQLKVDVFDRTQQKKLSSGGLQTLETIPSIPPDTTTGTIKFDKRFLRMKDSSLFPNQFVNVRVLVDTHTKMRRQSQHRHPAQRLICLSVESTRIKPWPCNKITVGTTPDGNV